jgi:hypothetical protein
MFFFGPDSASSPGSGFANHAFMPENFITAHFAK